MAPRIFVMVLSHVEFSKFIFINYFFFVYWISRKMKISSTYNRELKCTYAVLWENVPSDMCDKRRLKSACTSSQSYQKLRCVHEDTLRHWLSKRRLAKIQIRLRECAVWSESSLGAHIRRYVCRICGSFYIIFLLFIARYRISCETTTGSWDDHERNERTSRKTPWRGTVQRVTSLQQPS